MNLLKISLQFYLTVTCKWTSGRMMMKINLILNKMRIWKINYISSNKKIKKRKRKNWLRNRNLPIYVAKKRKKKKKKKNLPERKEEEEKEIILFDKIEFPNFNFSDYFENDNFFEIFVIIVSKLNKDK